MRSIIFALALLATPAYAVDYVQPQGAPQLTLPSGLTISVFAVQTPVGHGIGIFERDSAGKWQLCGTCLPVLEYPTMDPAIAAAGGPAAYVASRLPAINDALARRYPATAPQTGIGGVNQALSSNALVMVNGVPTLLAK